ncbi:hypothetical protein O6P43_013224 [Quillaja saponaria]|uniref:Transmembrane protein n=1 Tax=Quillaja saponaria TaxID=32244 RepID=A0AAD7M3A4_QUISA|nr:hypothetical protein O6P43_013224 [Quillaja saponaria]
MGFQRFCTVVLNLMLLLSFVAVTNLVTPTIARQLKKSSAEEGIGNNEREMEDSSIGSKNKDKLMELDDANNLPLVPQIPFATPIPQIPFASPIPQIPFE